jgi:hypothetical protein
MIVFSFLSRLWSRRQATRPAPAAIHVVVAIDYIRTVFPIQAITHPYFPRNVLL